MGQQKLILKAKGLYSFPNDFSEMPDGALSTADNVECRREGVIESRRGFENIPDTLASDANQLIDFDAHVIAHREDNILSYHDGTIWHDYTSTVSVADSNLGRLKHAQSNNNLYLCGSTGVKKLEAYNAGLASAGVPAGLDVSAALSGSAGFLDGGKNVAYRILWGIKDSNQNLILGAPSQRCVIDNTNGASTFRDVALDATIPDGITTSHFMQVYRSAQFTTGTEPDDELQLVYEVNPTNTDLTNKYIQVTDNTPDGLRGATIYTAQSQQGIAKSNYEPPFSKDIDLYRTFMFFSNCSQKQRLIETLLGVGTGGIAINDTITIAGETYTAAAAESVANKEFKVFSAGSAAQNIADTAQSLCKVINRNASNTSIYAYYYSQVDELPGKMVFEARTFGQTTFTMSVSAHGSAFNPPINAPVSSTADSFVNGLYYSKSSQPEAVPLTQYILVGSAKEPILRIKASRDSLFIFKGDGIFRLTGFDEASWRIEAFDLTSNLLAPDSLVKLNNQIYALTTQGVVSVSDNGVSVLSRPIENKFNELLGADADGLAKYTFAIPYETDRKYILFTITKAGETACTQAFVYNFFTNSWTRWVKNATCGMIFSEDDKIYIGIPDLGLVSKERKSYTFRDFVDEPSDVEIIEVIDATHVQLAILGNTAVGDILYLSANKYSQVSAIDTLTNTVTLLYGVTWTTGTAQVYPSIKCLVKWAPQMLGNLYLMKHNREIAMIFKNSFFVTARVGFSTNLSKGTQYVTVSGSGLGAPWGRFPWGSQPWGGGVYSRAVRVLLPPVKQRFAWVQTVFECQNGYSQFQIDGVGFTFNFADEKITR